MKRINFIALTVVSVILCEAFGMMQWINELIPLFSSLIIGLKVFTASIKMLLSDLVTSESLKPGVSKNFAPPTVPICTQGVTALKDSMLLNSHGKTAPL